MIDARRGVAMFKQVNVPILGVVENMSYFLCPHCGGRTEIFAHAGARAEAEKLGAPFLGDIPLDADIRARSDAGMPVVATMPDSPQAAAFGNIAAQIAETLEHGVPGARPGRASASSDSLERSSRKAERSRYPLKAARSRRPQPAIWSTWRTGAGSSPSISPLGSKSN